MERLTFEGNFCDIAQCREIPCPYNGACSQRKVWERLKAYEDTGLEPDEVTATEDLAPVVRCKDCMHYLIVDEFEGGKRYMCKVNHFSYINSDGDMHYCSYGERKEDKAE